EYNPALIVPTGMYGVRADIHVGDSVWFSTSTAIPVITQGSPTANLELIVTPATGGEISPIVGRHWEWVSTTQNGQQSGPVTAGDTVLYLSPDGNASADTDCNSFGGEYTLSGTTVSIEFTVSTLIACPETS